MNQNYPKSSRLLKPSDFNYLKSKPEKLVSQNLVIFYKNSQILNSSSRLGVSVSKKAGNAVFRNKMKRIIREEFRRSAVKSKGLDILIVIKNKTKISITDTRSDLLNSLNKMGNIE